MSQGERLLRFAAGHPAFAGHFPGQPIVPGVLLLDQAQRAIAAGHPEVRNWRLASAKFIRPLRPDETACLRWQPGAGRSIAFTFDCDGQTVASGSLAAADGAP